MALIEKACPRCGKRQRVSKLQHVLECKHCKRISRLIEGAYNKEEES